MKLSETPETVMLEQYLAQPDVGGRIYAEVPIGRHPDSSLWSSECSVRRTDGVRVAVQPNDTQVVPYQTYQRDFSGHIKHHTPELIEVKGSLNEALSGRYW